MTVMFQKHQERYNGQCNRFICIIQIFKVVGDVIVTGVAYGGAAEVVNRVEIGTVVGEGNGTRVADVVAGGEDNGPE